MLKKMTRYDVMSLLESHSLWLSSDGKKGKRGALIGVDLSEENLSGLNLNYFFISDSCLKGAFLAQTSLDGADIKDSDLSEAAMDGITLRCAEVVGVNFSKSIMRDAKIIYPQIKRSTFSKADLSGCLIIGVNIKG